MGRVKNSIALILVLLIAATLSALRKPDLVMLYPKNLLQSDLSLIMRALENADFSYSLDSKMRFLLVESHAQSEIRSYLIERGLPTGVDTRSASVILSPEMTSDQKLSEQRRLESELALNFRELTVMKDARVSLAIPDHYHDDSERKASARILVQLEKDASLSSPQIQSIAATTALTVPMLEMGNVKIVDSSGRSLYDRTTPQD